MLFNSFEFIALLSITFVLYYLPVMGRFQVQLLIITSLFFYAYSQPLLVLLLLFSAAINIITSYYVVYGNPGYRKAMATAGVVLNLSILIFFKYSPLIALTFFNSPGSVGQFLVHLPLPIGISFFTFQGISLVIDVYREKDSGATRLVPRSLLHHAKQILFFKAFFPQLISGPIVKAYDFIPQIEKKLFPAIANNWRYNLIPPVIDTFPCLPLAITTLRTECTWAVVKRWNTPCISKRRWKMFVILKLIEAHDNRPA